MKQIAQLTLPGDLEVDILFANGKLAYTFNYQEQTYGNAVKLPSKKVTDIATVCLALFTNAIETRKALEK